MHWSSRFNGRDRKWPAASTTIDINFSWKETPAAEYRRKLISSPPAVAGSSSAEREFMTVVRQVGHIFACKVNRSTAWSMLVSLSTLLFGPSMVSGARQRRPARFLKGFLVMVAPQQSKLPCLVAPEVPPWLHVPLISLAFTFLLSEPPQSLTAH